MRMDESVTVEYNKDRKNDRAKTPRNTEGVPKCKQNRSERSGKPRWAFRNVQTGPQKAALLVRKAVSERESIARSRTEQPLNESKPIEAEIKAAGTPGRIERKAPTGGM